MGSCDEKLERANQHLKTLEDKLYDWFLSHPYSTTDDIDPDTGENVVRVKIDAVPTEVAILVGECFYNLRGSLDHLAHALAWKNRLSLSDEESTETSFPIFRYKEGFCKRGKGRIKYLSPQAQTEIQGLQPYLAGDKAESHPLWLLEKLHNIDKHRALLITATAQRMLDLHNPHKGALKYLRMTVVHIAAGYTELARYRFLNPEDGSRVNVNIEPTFQVVFQQRPANNLEIVSTLHTIRNVIADEVFPKLCPLI